MRLEETALSEVDRYIIMELSRFGDGIGVRLPEGKIADCAAELVAKGYMAEVDGYYFLTDAGRSQLKPNR